MFLALQDPKPFVVVPIPAPVHETSFVDVIMSAMGLTGALIVASLVLGAGFIGGAVRLVRRADRRAALSLYLFSLAYLAVLFVSMVADVRL